MIYQCFFKEEQRAGLFRQDCYAPFGLEPEVNADLGRNCPELQVARNRMALTEYAAFLWHFRNRDANPHAWIGFTSHRQLDKSAKVFESGAQIEALLGRAKQGFGWRYYNMYDGSGRPLTLARQCEHLHPGLLALAAELVEVPVAFHTETGGFFANYWVLPRPLFDDYMAYSLPVALKALQITDHPYFERQQRATKRVTKEKYVGYLMERVFVFWYLKNKLQLANAGDVGVVKHNL